MEVGDTVIWKPFEDIKGTEGILVSIQETTVMVKLLENFNFRDCWNLSAGEEYCFHKKQIGLKIEEDW